MPECERATQWESIMNYRCLSSGDPQLVGDPVDTLTGAVIERQRDFRLAGPLPLQWWRHYDSSKSNQKFALGWGQTHDFDCSLRFDQDGLRYQSALGPPTGFAPLEANGQSTASYGKTLTRLDLYRYKLTQHAQPDREFVFKDLNEAAPLHSLVENGSRIEFQYDADGRLSAIIDSLGNQLEVSTSPEGLVQEIAIPRQGKRDRRDLLTYQYDNSGRLVAGIDGFNSRFSMKYEGHYLVGKTDRLGHSFLFSYDALGRCTRSVGRDGLLDHRIEYTVPGQLTTVTRGDGGSWRYRYQLGKLVAIEDPLGGVQRFVYDDQGNVIEEIDPSGGVTTIVVDASGARLGKIDPLGHFHVEPQDLNETDPIRERSPANPLEYELGRLIPQNLHAAHDDRIMGTRSGFSNSPPTHSESRAVQAATEFGFVVGYNWWPQPAQGRHFDASGDLIQQAGPGGGSRRWMYDGNGNLTKFVDFDQRTWTYEYSSWNLRVRETDPLGHAVIRRFDAQENLTAFVDPGGTVSEYAYDLKDQLIEVRRAGQLRERYERDPTGNLRVKLASDGQWLLRIEYGPGHLPVRRELQSGDIHELEYDQHGRILKASTGKHQVQYQYDALGNRVLEKRDGLGVEQTHLGWRRFEHCTWFEKFTVKYQSAGDECVITDPTGTKQRFKFSAQLSVERRFSNGCVEQATYDEQGRCVEKHLQHPTDTPWKRSYQWSGEGELKSVSDNQRGETRYEYDAAHRLAKSVAPSGLTEEFVFDSANNLLRQPGLDGSRFEAGNRLRATATETFEYDGRHHIHSRSSAGGRTVYHYDSRDQLVRVELPTGVWAAEYDAQGRRLRKVFRDQATEYYWSGNQLAAEIRSDRSLRLYIYSDPLALAPWMFVDYASLEASPESGKRFFVLSDQVGSPVRIIDDLGEVVWRGESLPFGQMLLGATNTLTYNPRFPGHYWDDELGLNYNRYRYFDPVLGRYIQSDPLGIGGGTNVYAYVVNPLVVADVNGLTCPYCERHDIDPTKCPDEHKDTEVVYVHVDKDGKVVYIGITNAPERRAGEHARSVAAGEKSGVTMIVVSGPVSHDDARNIESLAIRARLDASNVDPNASVQKQLAAAGLDNDNRGRTDDRRKEAPGTNKGIQDTGITGEAFDLKNSGKRIE